MQAVHMAIICLSNIPASKGSSALLAYFVLLLEGFTLLLCYHSSTCALTTHFHPDSMNHKPIERLFSVALSVKTRECTRHPHPALSWKSSSGTMLDGSPDFPHKMKPFYAIALPALYFYNFNSTITQYIGYTAQRKIVTCFFEKFTGFLS